MTTTIHSRVAIRERIADFRRHHHDSDYGLTHVLFWDAKAQAERVRWFWRG
jgi:hypothetical protein